MPKNVPKGRTEGRGFRMEDNHYFGHDDRVYRPEVRKVANRQVSFKCSNTSKDRVGPSRIGRYGPKYAQVMRYRDDNVTMDGQKGRFFANTNAHKDGVMMNKWRGYTKGRNSPVPYRDSTTDGYRPRGILGETSWYKITIPMGFESMKFSKEEIISQLQNAIKMQIVPIMYKTMGNDAVFYVDENQVAKELIQLRQVKMDDGAILHIRAKPEIPQSPVINDGLKEALKLAMAKRYRPDTKALDLSKFYLDPDLVDTHFCGLFRAPMLMVVLDIVSDHIQDLAALNLDGNKLMVVDKLRVLEQKFPKLKILHMGDNRVRGLNQLMSAKDLKIEELRLEGNPLCNKYKKNKDEYASALRKIFPKLVRLDGEDLPPPIHFDVADDGVKLPPSKPLYVVNEDVQKIASQFILQYFHIYDSENRQPLLEAYHEHACFSLTVPITGKSSKFIPYVSENRNLRRVTDSERRRKLLKQGRLPVVTCISELPKTKHDLDSFTMDINLISNTMMLITVSGLFKQISMNDGIEPIRFFNRTFIIVPQGGGFCICNEQLFITDPTERQEKQMISATTLSTSLGGSSGATHPVAASPVVVPPNAVPLVAQAMPMEPTEEVKQKMALTLSQQTNMNVEWSLKCLVDVKWNYDVAVAAFQELFTAGRVPPEAFNK